MVVMANQDLIEYPQNAPTVKTHKGLKVALASAAAVIALTAGAWGGSNVITSVNAANASQAQIIAQKAVPAAPIGDATTDENALAQSDVEGAQAIATEQAAEALAAQVAAQQAAQVAAEAAQAAAARVHSASTGDGKHPAGTPLPFIASSDPNNANGGDYEDPSIFCESGSASTVNGVPVCD